MQNPNDMMSAMNDPELAPYMQRMMGAFGGKACFSFVDTREQN